MRSEVVKTPWALPQEDVHVSQLCVSQVRMCQVHVCPTCVCVSGASMLTQVVELFQLSTSNVCTLLCIRNI